MVFMMKNWLAILSMLTCAFASISAAKKPFEDSSDGLISDKGLYPGRPGPEEGVIPEELDDEAFDEIIMDQDEELDEDIDNADER
jgi:hypothetical protein